MFGEFAETILSTLGVGMILREIVLHFLGRKNKKIERENSREDDQISELNAKIAKLEDKIELLSELLKEHQIKEVESRSNSELLDKVVRLTFETILQNNKASELGYEKEIETMRDLILESIKK